ncbi:HEAT repeat domain-containing protein [Bacteroidota bacterium]
MSPSNNSNKNYTNEEILELIKVLRSDTNQTEARSKLSELAEKKDARLITPLTTIVEVGNRYARIAAVEMFGYYDDKKVFKSLVKALSDADEAVREGAIESLGKIGNTHAINPIKKCIDSFAYDSWTRKRAESVLEKLRASSLAKTADEATEQSDESENIKSLIKSLANPYKEDEAKEELKKIGAPAVEALIVSLKSKNHSISGPVADLLGEIKDPRAIEPLIDAMDDNFHARYALEEFGDLCVEPLIAVLKGEQKEKMENAAKILGNLKDNRAVEPLINLLGDSKLDYYLQSALKEIGTPAVEPLISVLGSKDSAVRKNAAEILGEIGSKKGLKALKTLLDDNDEDVRISAAIALDDSGSWSFKDIKNVVFKGKLVGLCDLCGIETLTLSNVYTYNAAGVPDTTDEVGKLVCKECYMKVANNDPELTRNAGKAHRIAKKYMKQHKEEFHEE